MDREILKSTAERFPWASWAIWDDGFPDANCVEQQPERLFEFVSERAERLTPDVVLLGLNRSDDLPAPFSNFHAPTRAHYDYRLKEFIQDGGLSRLQGAYMTDLVDEVESESESVTVTDDDAAVLLEQLRLLGEPTYHVVCFGNKPFEGVTRYFEAKPTPEPPAMKHATVETGGLTLHCYRVWFYGLYGVHQDKVGVLGEQLAGIDERIR